MIPKELDRSVGDKIRKLPKEARELLEVVTLYYEPKIQELKSRIKELEDQRSKNSRNSSKPSSSDPSHQKPKSTRGKSSKKSSGQKGCQGRRHDLSEVKYPWMLSASSLASKEWPYMMPTPVIGATKTVRTPYAMPICSEN